MPDHVPRHGPKAALAIRRPVKFIGTEEDKLIKFREIRDQIKWKVKDWVDGQK